MRLRGDGVLLCANPKHRHKFLPAVTTVRETGKSCANIEVQTPCLRPAVAAAARSKHRRFATTHWDPLSAPHTRVDGGDPRAPFFSNFPYRGGPFRARRPPPGASAAACVVAAGRAGGRGRRTTSGQLKIMNCVPICQEVKREGLR